MRQLLHGAAVQDDDLGGAEGDDIGGAAGTGNEGNFPHDASRAKEGNGIPLRGAHFHEAGLNDIDLLAEVVGLDQGFAGLVGGAGTGLEDDAGIFGRETF